MASYTAQVLINKALTKLGILDAGGSPSASDSTEALDHLNYMIQQWQDQKRFIWGKDSSAYQLTAGQQVYPIGPTATAPFNVPRPVKIEHAYFQITVAGVLISNELDIINAKQWADIVDESAQSNVADRMYYDHASPNGNLYLWPKPACNVVSKLQLLTWYQLSSYATLATSNDLPNGYPEAIIHALALRLMPIYGMSVDTQVGKMISDLAQQAEQVIEELNAQVLGDIPEQPVAIMEKGN